MYNFIYKVTEFLKNEISWNLQIIPVGDFVSDLRFGQLTVMNLNFYLFNESHNFIAPLSIKQLS